MKVRLLFIMLIAMASMQCKAPKYFIGMSEEDFLRKNKVQTVESTARYSVYKKINYPFGAPPIVKFFYFRDGELFRVDGGERQPDIIIQSK